jgi:C4-dicarboxylate-specific signal transduction histidine kinase
MRWFGHSDLVPGTKSAWAQGVWRTANQCLFGIAAVALVTFVCFRLQTGLTIVALLYLIIVVLLSVSGGFVPSILASVIAVLCLDYFFAKPIFSLQLTDPLEVVALIAFSTAASVTSYVMLQRKRVEDALRESEQRRRADQAEQALHEAQVELAHVGRVMSLGELTTSIAHEINQPLAGVVTNAQASLRWLNHEPPRLDEVRSAVERIVRDGNRASDVIRRIRAIAKKADPQKVSLDINDVIQEGVSLVRREILSRGVSLRTEFAPALPPVIGDRVQLQQVLINLMMNGVEAMAAITDRAREILVRSQQHEAEQVLVAVRDSGVGINPENIERLFNAFYTTKPSGLGIGLSISRSIIAAHGGRLWVSPNADHGATFQFTVPVFGGGVS